MCVFVEYENIHTPIVYLVQNNRSTSLKPTWSHRMLLMCTLKRVLTVACYVPNEFMITPSTALFSRWPAEFQTDPIMVRTRGIWVVRMSPQTSGASQLLFFFLIPTWGPCTALGVCTGGRAGLLSFLSTFLSSPRPLQQAWYFFRNIFYPHMGPQFGPEGLLWGRRPLEIIFKQVFVLPKTSGTNHIIFWNIFYPHVGPQFGP
jgi:hypothetical protein